MFPSSGQPDHVGLQFAIKLIVLMLLFALPSWGVIMAQVGHFIGWREYFTSIRFFLVFCVIAVAFYLFLFNIASIKVTAGALLLLFFCLYAMLHFLGGVGIYLYLEGLRHEVVYVLLSVSLVFIWFVVKDTAFIPSNYSFFLSVLVNGAVSILFGVWQYFNIEILETLYRVPLSEIRNITLATGDRLTSTMVNPINFGAFLVIFYFALFSVVKSKLIRGVFFILIFLLVLGTQSRLALLAFMAGVFVYACLSRDKYIAVSSLLLLSVFLIAFFVLAGDAANLDDRLARSQSLASSSTYSENIRLQRWVQIISNMSFIDFFWGVGAGASSPSWEDVNRGAVIIENSYISVLYQYGLIGLILFFALLFRFYRNAYFILRVDNSLGKFLMSFLVVFSVMSMGNDFLRNLPFSFYFWYLFASLEVKVYDAKRRFL